MDGRQVRPSKGALAGRQISGMAGCGIPSTSLRLPHDVPGAELYDVDRRLRRGLPPGRRAVGRCQVDGMPHDPQRGHDEEPGRMHQKGTTAPGIRPWRSKPGANALRVPVTSRDPPARTPSSGGTRRYGTVVPS